MRFSLPLGTFPNLVSSLDKTVLLRAPTRLLCTAKTDVSGLHRGSENFEVTITIICGLITTKGNPKELKCYHVCVSHLWHEACGYVGKWKSESHVISYLVYSTRCGRIFYTKHNLLKRVNIPLPSRDLHKFHPIRFDTTSHLIHIIYLKVEYYKGWKSPK